jgi:hypothetical protein
MKCTLYLKNVLGGKFNGRARFFPLGFFSPLGGGVGSEQDREQQKKPGCLPEIFQDQTDLKKGPNGREKDDLAKMPRGVWDGGVLSDSLCVRWRGEEDGDGLVDASRGR